MATEMIDRIPSLARGTRVMAKFAGAEISTDLAGLAELDDFFASFWDAHETSKPTTIAGYGCLIGEIIRTAFGGEWMFDDVIGYHLTNVGDAGITVFPFAQSMRRFQDPTHSLAALGGRLAEAVETRSAGTIDAGDETSLANFILDTRSAPREPAPGAHPTIEPDVGLNVERRISLMQPNGDCISGTVRIETVRGGELAVTPDTPSHFVLSFAPVDEGEAPSTSREIGVYDLLFRDGERVADVDGDLDQGGESVTGAIAGVLDGRDLVTYETQTEQRSIHVKYMDTRIRLRLDEHGVTVRCCHHQGHGFGGYRTIEYAREWSDLITGVSRSDKASR